MTDASRPPDVGGDDPDRYVPGSEPVVPGRLDPALDPDRYVPGSDGRLDPTLDPDRYDARAEPVVPVRLDPAADPDRYAPGDGGGRTLTEMLGEGAQEDSRDTYTWLVGLLGVLTFLGLVALVARNLGP